MIDVGFEAYDDCYSACN